MSIISIDQSVKANISYGREGLDIAFPDDPSYARSESVIIDLMQRSIGLIFQGAYHHIGNLPEDYISRESASYLRARLHGAGEKGKEIELHAPVKVMPRLH